jgi:hypothetical protein
MGRAGFGKELTMWDNFENCAAIIGQSRRSIRISNPERIYFSKTIIFVPCFLSGALEEPYCIDQPHSAPDFRRKPLDERQMIEIQLVVQVERVE